MYRSTNMIYIGLARNEYSLLKLIAKKSGGQLGVFIRVTTDELRVHNPMLVSKELQRFHQLGLINAYLIELGYIEVILTEEGWVFMQTAKKYK